MSAKTAEATVDFVEEPISRGRRFARLAGWMSFGIVCLIFFTLLKLPEDRIKNYIDGNIASMLAERGITFTSHSGQLSFLFGLSYTMKDIMIGFPPPNMPVHIDKIQISPSIIPFLFSTYSGRVSVENGQGELNAAFSLKNTQFSASYKAKKIELKKLGILPYLANVSAAAIVDGAGSFTGDYTNFASLDGDGTLTLSQISMEPQSIAGFSTPQISISDAVVEVKADKGKATFKTIRIGKTPTAKSIPDDIQGTVSGDITLAKVLEFSQVNLKLKFKFSENIMKAFVLLDALLGAGKQPDGSYSFTLTGPLLAPMPAPANN